MSCLWPSGSHWSFGLQPLPYQTACACTRRTFLCPAAAILACLLLSFGVPALSGRELVTVSQPRSWSLRHVLVPKACLSCWRYFTNGCQNPQSQLPLCPWYGVGTALILVFVFVSPTFPLSGKDTSVQSDPEKHRPRLLQELWAGPSVSGLAGLMLMPVQAVNVQLTLRQSGSSTRQPPR